MRTLPQPVLQMTSRQLGLASRAQLLVVVRRLGLAAPAIDFWVRRGHLEVVYRGVYRLAGCPTSHEQDALAKVLRAGDGAAAGGEMTLGLFRFEGFRLAQGGTGVLVPTGRRVTGVPFPIRATALPHGHRATVARVPALTPTRALVEYAHAEQGKRWRVTFDDACRRRLTFPERLRQCARTLLPHPGALACLTLLGDPSVSGLESEGERGLDWLVRDIEPAPEWQVTDLVPGRRLDFAWREALFAVEYDGRDHHVLPTDRDHDGLRDLEAAENGVQVLRITAGMLRDDPDRTRAMVIRALRRRLAEQAVLRTERARDAD
ncbi:MAG: type IV toxin-antitoxin system AbiEi family antitoxin domain-containing protein [Egibacteraceae bacterium]